MIIATAVTTATNTSDLATKTTLFYMMLGTVTLVIGLPGAVAASWALLTKKKRAEKKKVQEAREEQQKDIAHTLLWVSGIPADRTLTGVPIKGAPIQLHELNESVARLIKNVGSNGKPLADKMEDLHKVVEQQGKAMQQHFMEDTTRFSDGNTRFNQLDAYFKDMFEMINQQNAAAIAAASTVKRELAKGPDK